MKARRSYSNAPSLTSTKIQRRSRRTSFAPIAKLTLNCPQPTTALQGAFSNWLTTFDDAWLKTVGYDGEVESLLAAGRRRAPGGAGGVGPGGGGGW